jgi:hypothetical protein
LRNTRLGTFGACLKSDLLLRLVCNAFVLTWLVLHLVADPWWTAFSAKSIESIRAHVARHIPRCKSGLIRLECRPHTRLTVWSSNQQPVYRRHGKPRWNPLGPNGFPSIVLLNHDRFHFQNHC